MYKVGQVIRFKTDWFPAREGATATVIHEEKLPSGTPMYGLRIKTGYVIVLHVRECLAYTEAAM